MSAGAQCEPEALVPNAPADGFGASVAVSGDQALVGAIWDSGAGGDFGSAILFERVGGVWSQTARLAPDIPPIFGRFGHSVAIEGDVALAGAPYSGSGSGTAYIFERVGGAWTQVLAAYGGEFFGWSVDLDGDAAIIGGLFDGSAGHATVYRRGASNWAMQQYLVADVPITGDDFGWSVAIDPPWVVVGALRRNLPAAGSAYVFLESGGVWTSVAELSPSDGQGGEDFGSSVAIDGRRIVIRCRDLGGGYVYEFDGSSWVETAKLSGPSGIDGVVEVAVDGDTVLVGSHVFVLDSGSWNQVGLLSTESGPHPGNHAALSGGTAVLGHAGAHAFDLAECSCGTSTYCAGAPNSAGPGARMSAAGSTSISANDLQLHVDGAIAGQFGVFYYGAGQTQQVFGDGFRCVAGGAAGLFRLNPPQLADLAGSTSRAFDLTAFPAVSGPGMISPGSSWNFQFWYRDPAFGGSGFNLSDGLHVIFCP